MVLFKIIETVLTIVLLSVATGAIYRLYFHPLRHIPGPKLAALTWWYEFYFDVIQPGQYVFQIKKLHQSYGPIIRITPDELHVNDVGFLDTIYAPSTSRRDKYARNMKQLRVPGGIGSTVSFDLHKKRREALAPFFSKRNVLYLEPLITGKVQQLCNLIAVSNAHTFMLTKYSMAENFLFAHEFNNLADEKKAALLCRNTYQLLRGVHRNKHLPWIPDILEKLPPSITKPMMPPGLVDMFALFARVRAELVAIIAAKASGNTNKSLGPTGKESVYDSVLDNASLPESEKSLPRLQNEGALLVLAGTESPAKTLSIVFYNLITHPLILAQLRKELSTLLTNATWTQLEQLPYLSAIIGEGNRLAFGVTARTARISYEPLTYTPSQYASNPLKFSRSYIIPGGTPVSTTTLSAHTAESVFPDPFIFKPERWLGEDGRLLRKFRTAFGKGGRKCLGIELARTELLLATAALVRKFELKLWNTDEREVAFVHDYQVAHSNLDSKGIRVMVDIL
ncbi:cytochrome P450 [Sclerotinia borealis F-4128]|uniref:Cytochrome P450 n=1 Tax=Sclerotinia borealis (strain F-4128) TaxID=1432307 RepID=W9C8Z0_SCLBF|nr:cytochrome P450 [Sclerotinia borealis F-4128]